MATRIATTYKTPLRTSTAVELMPGDVAIGLLGDQLKTLLGSCVSIILTDPRRTVAAMCHIVHVGKPLGANVKNTAFGMVAMSDMYARLTALGVIPARCEAYVFGGGNMFPDQYAATHVGQNNSDWAFDFLHSQGIPVVDHCVGGNGYRKVSWTVGAGEPQVETVFASLPSNDGH